MLTPDLSLLRSYTPDDDLVVRPPVVNPFARDGKYLFFINAHHVSGTGNLTCAAVRQAFDTCDPRFVILEGFPSAWGVTPDRYLHVMALYEEEGFTQGGEVAFAASLAHARGIPFQGGEPTDAEQLASAQAKGFSILDYVGYDLLLYVPQDQMTGIATTETDLLRLAEDRLARGFGYIAESDKPDMAAFLAWLERHNGSRALLDLTNEDNMPSGAADANWLQRLTNAMTRARDAHLLQLIAARLDEHGRVLVVYGDGHLVTCRAVLEDMLAPARLEML